MGEGMTFTLHHSSDLGEDDGVGVGGWVIFGFTISHLDTNLI